MNPWQSKYKSHQGNYGLGQAIAYYTSKCIPISIPLNDTQKYDLIIDVDGILKRVQVKTTRYKNKYGTYNVELHNTGGASGKSNPRLFDKTSCDLLFIITDDGTYYEIPTECINVFHSLALNKSVEMYKVIPSWVSSAHSEMDCVDGG